MHALYCSIMPVLLSEMLSYPPPPPPLDYNATALIMLQTQMYSQALSLVVSGHLKLYRSNLNSESVQDRACLAS